MTCVLCRYLLGNQNLNKSISIYYFSERTCGSGEEGDGKGEPGENSEEGKEYLL
jgi:hypothetical protein